MLPCFIEEKRVNRVTVRKLPNLFLFLMNQPAWLFFVLSWSTLVIEHILIGFAIQEVTDVQSLWSRGQDF